MNTPLQPQPQPQSQPQLQHILCPQTLSSVAASAQQPAPAPSRRMAYWQWNATGNPDHPHVIVCVHGLTRQGRDFDVLAQDLSRHARVICPDMAGRGHSDWLPDPLAYGLPQYALDMLALLHHLHAQAPITTLDWVGTSMGGLIGMAVAGNPQLPLPCPIRRLVLNDVGPRLEWPALQRITAYTGQNPHFASEEEGAAALRALAPGFGPHTDEQWLALSRPMLRPAPQGGFELHYDPAIAAPMQGMTQAQSEQGEALLWALYDAISAQTLLLRGAQSDLLSSTTAQEMAQRGPRAACHTLEGVGHAPTLVDTLQRDLVRQFLGF